MLCPAPSATCICSFDLYVKCDRLKNVRADMYHADRTVGRKRELSIFDVITVTKFQHAAISGHFEPFSAGVYQNDHKENFNSGYGRQGPWGTWRSFSDGHRVLFSKLHAHAKVFAK